MSEVDRLSNSGLYPALPIADRRGSNASKDESGRKAREDARAQDKTTAKPPDGADPGQPRPPKSLIDEYA